MATKGFRRDYPAELSIDQRIEESPIFSTLESSWQTARFAGKTLWIAARPPYSWIRDAIAESDATFRKCIVPLIIAQAIWLIGFGVLNFGEVAGLLGVVDRDPGGVYTGYVREVSTWVTMMIVAGVAASSLAADLGARKIREELDALAVLGVDTFRKLVVPRVMAMVFSAVILGLIGLLIAMAVNYALVPNYLEIEPAVFRRDFYLSIDPIDLYLSMIKHVIIGLVLGVIACQQGFGAKGGAEGVGRAVAKTVIISFVSLWAINTVFNTAALTLFPSLSIQKG